MRCLVPLFVLFGHATASAKDERVQTVPYVDRYAGKWYEIARLSNRFQRDCVGATAKYGLGDDGAISVVNTCYRSDGTTRSIEGKAVVQDKGSNAKLRVRFNGFFFKLFPGSSRRTTGCWRSTMIIATWSSHAESELPLDPRPATHDG